MTQQCLSSRSLCRALVVMSAILLVLGACAKSKPLALSLEGKSDMNGGYACRVCIYQLKTDVNFAAAQLESFWGNAPAPFQADLAAPRLEVILDPGKTQEKKIDVSKETQFIGAAADFRRPDRDGWRKILPFSPKKGILPGALRKTRRIVLIVSAGGIEIQQ